MLRTRRGATPLTVVAAIGALSLGALVARPPVPSTIPERIADTTFWRIVSTFSEQSGSFPSENFVSNELEWQYVIPALLNRVGTPAGGAYLGVGPEQNFTYIASIKPRIAFICDIRRQNLVQHLMYKALIEMSSDRADFLSKLWARPRPEGLDSSSDPSSMLEAFQGVRADTVLRDLIVAAMFEQLVRKHGFALTPGDSTALRKVYGVFVANGPEASYSSASGYPVSLTSGSTSGTVWNWSTRSNGIITTAINGVTTIYHISTDSMGRSVVRRDSAGTMVVDTTFRFTMPPRLAAPSVRATSLYPTFGTLMSMDDGAGVNRGWLGSEAAFQWLKDFQLRNLVIPVVGNFAGPKALRAVAGFLREHETKVSAFYTSNVEQYLFQYGISADFYENVALLPRDSASTFIRSFPFQVGPVISVRNPGSRLAQTISPMDTVIAAFSAGNLTTYAALAQLQIKH
jgi:hypothetical protein